MGEKKELTVEIEKAVSYVMGVPRDERTIMDIPGLNEKLEQTELFEFVDMKIKENPVVVLNYMGKQYEVMLILEEVDIPSVYRINHRFSEADINALQEAKYGITTAMTFTDDFMTSYHVQLKVISALMPELLGIVDFSAERIYSGVWATLAASSMVPPSPNYLYTIQAVSEDNKVWMHTHGLNRCGRIELEILDVDTKYYNDYAPIIQGYADRLLSQNLEAIGVAGEAEMIAYTNDQQPLVATWIPWPSAVKFYDEDMLGGAKSHEEHGNPAGAIFLYLSGEDYKEGKFSPVNVLGDELHDNVMVLFSLKETERMQRLARERFNYFANCVDRPNYHGIVKFGLEVDDEYREKNKSEKEHIWFEILEVNGTKMKARLTQEPYMIANLKTNDILELDIDQMTDWLIYTPEFSVSPDNVYLLEM